MSKTPYLFLALFLLAACEVPPQEKKQQTRDLSKPQMMRIALQRPEQADSLIQAGVDVIVVEHDYVIARIPNDMRSNLSAAHLPATYAAESDLTQRLVRIAAHSKDDLTKFSELGLDIWESEGDTVLARAFDKQLRQLTELGFSVQIVARDALEFVRKQSAAK